MLRHVGRDRRSDVTDLGECDRTGHRIECHANDIEQVGACLSTERLIAACSFMAISGPGSATGVVTSTRPPSARMTSMVTSVAVSFAHV
jgi:hypothetical protein